VENDEWRVCWHVSPSVNRASIERHGLDWQRMGPIACASSRSTDNDAGVRPRIGDGNVDVTDALQMTVGREPAGGRLVAHA
jgi:hypothetical protein